MYKNFPILFTEEYPHASGNDLDVDIGIYQDVFACKIMEKSMEFL